MPIPVKEPESKYKPAPQGIHQAVCVDVWDVSTELRPEEWGGGIQDKTRIVWMLNEEMEDGRPFEASKKYTMSLHEKSNLTKDLTSWRGKEFTPEEKKWFDLEKLIGVNCQLQIVHNTAKDGKVYGNVQSVVPLAKGMPKMNVPADYVRKKDRDPKPAPAAEPIEDFQASDDDVPF